MTNRDSGPPPVPPSSGSPLPLLGGTKPRSAVMPLALIRELDEQGTFEPEQVGVNAQGGPHIVIGRYNIVSATDLCDMIIDRMIERGLFKPLVTGDMET